MKKLLQFLFVISAVFATSVLPAQETPKKDAPEAPRIHKFYKLSFLIYELEDGKKINERSYTFPAITEGRRSSMKIGTRVPIVVKESQVQGVKESQVQYLDVGLDISCDLSEVADKLA